MDSNFFDIPFRTKSTDSDFSCKDGELDDIYGVTLSTGSETGIDSLTGITDGNLPPMPDIDFAIVRTTLPGWHNHPDVYPSKSILASTPDLDYWTKMASQLLWQFKSEATWHNLFVAPFLVMAAWKTKEGTNLSCSSPVLMIPNSYVPIVATTGDLSASELELKIAGAVCSLHFKMRAPEILRDFVGIIDALEILVSEPLQSYNTFEAFLPVKNISSTAYCRCLDPDTGIVSSSRICSETLPVGWKANVKGLTEGYDVDKDCEPANKIFRPFLSIPLSEVDLANAWTPVQAGGLGSIVYGMEEGMRYSKITSPEVSTSKPLTAIVCGQNKEMALSTRPIKLTGGSRLKKLRKVALRGKFTPEKISLLVSGSRDMLTWWPLALAEGTNIVALPRSTFRFFKASVKGYLSEGENLQGISIF